MNVRCAHQFFVPIGDVGVNFATGTYRDLAVIRQVGSLDDALGLRRDSANPIKYGAGLQPEDVGSKL